jgi:[ribosomal protein S18]-alanine N-acetyltransferase
MISIVAVDRETLARYLGRVVEIERQSFLSPWTPAMFREELNRGISRLWVLEAQGVCSGYICFWVVADEMHLLNLAVDPGQRGRGLGRRLLDAMIEHGVQAGARSVWLEVRPSNSAARALYRQAGFQEAGRRRRYYRETGEDAIIMSRVIGPSAISG